MIFHIILPRINTLQKIASSLKTVGAQSETYHSKRMRAVEMSEEGGGADKFLM